MKKQLFTILGNIQVQQTLILSCILYIGVVFFSLDISPLEIFTVFTTVILLDFLFLNFYANDSSSSWKFPFSGVNAGFGICFFLRSFDLPVYIFAWIIAIVSKYLFRFSGRHFFNPSNIAVCTTLILFPQYTWLNTLQWGNYTWEISWSYISVLLLVISLWSYMMFQVYRKFKFTYIYDLILPFLLLHFVLFFIIPYYESFSSFFLFFNVSFFVFTFFMLTDPKTVPMTSWGRIFYSFQVVLTFYVLQFMINENYAILWALFFNTILLPIIWNIEKNRKVYTFFVFLLFIIHIALIMLMLHKYWYPDFAFDNICNQLICK